MRRFLTTVILISACAAQAQTVDRTFPLTTPSSPQSVQEIVTLLRTMANLQAISASGMTISIRGTLQQAAIVEWLVHELDNPSTGPASIKLEYPVPNDIDANVRVVYLHEAVTPKALQELINVVRVIAETPFLSVYNQSHALILRGTAAQIALSVWILNALDRPESQSAPQDPLTYNYRGADPRFPVVRIFYLRDTPTLQAMQELVNVIRATADVRRIVPSPSGWAIAIRAHPESAALAEWLVKQLDNRGSGEPVSSYEYYSALDLIPIPAVRVFRLSRHVTDKELLDLVTSIRAAVTLPRSIPCPNANAIVIRGTATDAATAERIVRERAN